MDRPIVVGIAGGSASGKSTVVREVVRLLGAGRCAVLAHDAYYHDLSHLPLERRIEVNVDHPDSLQTDLLVAHIRALLDGGGVEMPSYDFASQIRAPTGRTVDPAPVVVVEGLFVLHDEDLRALMDLSVFVDTTEAERLSRRIERDTSERGRDRPAVVHQHTTRVQPMHERFVEPTRTHADVVISRGGHNLAAIQRLVRRVEELLASGGR